MSFNKNRKRSGVILAGVTTFSLAASAALHGIVRALPQNSAATSLLNNVPGEGAKNAGSSIVNFLKNNYGWLILAFVVIVGATVFLTDGGEKKEVVENKDGYDQDKKDLPEDYEKENKDNKTRNVSEIGNDIENENEMDFNKINKKESSLLDVILSEMEKIKFDIEIENKEEARGKFLKNYKLGSFFHTFFKEGRKIGDLMFSGEKNMFFYINSNISGKSSILYSELEEEDTDGAKLKEELFNKRFSGKSKKIEKKNDSVDGSVDKVKEIDTVEEILKKISNKDINEKDKILKKYDLGSDFEIFLSQLADVEGGVRGVFVDKVYGRYCVCYFDSDMERVSINDHQKNKKKGGIELEKKIFEALLSEKTANFCLKKNEEQDLKDKNKENLKLFNLNKNEN